MTVIAETIALPSAGTAEIIFESTPENSSSIGIRNTGTVTVVLGPANAMVFPLNAGEFYGCSVSADDTLWAQVQTSGTAGQITLLGMN